MPTTVEQIRDAIMRELPGIDISRAYAIAWKTYKRMGGEVPEGEIAEYQENDDDIRLSEHYASLFGPIFFDEFDPDNDFAQ